MGTIPDPNYDEGDDCTGCFGIGKEFGDVPTPERIKIVFSGMTSCPGTGCPESGTFILTQGIEPCYYHYGDLDGNTVDVHFFDGPGGSEYTDIYFGFGGYNCFWAQPGPCSVIANNSFDVAACSLFDTGCYGGSCEISWGPEI